MYEANLLKFIRKTPRRKWLPSRPRRDHLWYPADARRLLPSSIPDTDAWVSRIVSFHRSHVGNRDAKFPMAYTSQLHLPLQQQQLRLQLPGRKSNTLISRPHSHFSRLPPTLVPINESAVDFLRTGSPPENCPQKMTKMRQKLVKKLRENIVSFFVHFPYLSSYNFEGGRLGSAIGYSYI